MLYILTGKKGGGKTMRAVIALLDILEKTDKNVVTNLPLHVSEIQDEMMQRGRYTNVFERITFLDTKEMREFYRYRGSGVVVPKTGDDVVPLDYTESVNHPWCGKGVAYFIDEGAVLWPVRQFGKTPPELVYWNAQERKLGDEVWICVQKLELMEKQIALLAQEFRYMRNMSKERFGRFARGNYFEEEIHYYPRTAADDVAAERVKHHLDVKRICRCYDTNAGIGVQGKSGGDIGQTKKGIPLWVLFLAPLALVVGFWFASDKIPDMFMKGINGVYQSGKTQTQKAAGSPAPASVGRSKVPVSAPAVPKEDILPAVTVSGFVQRGSRINVVLSDGRVLTERDRDLLEVTGSGVRLASVGWLAFSKPSPRPQIPIAEAKAADVRPAEVSQDKGLTGQVLGAWRVDPDGVYRLVEPGMSFKLLGE